MLIIKWYVQITVNAIDVSWWLDSIGHHYITKTPRQTICKLSFFYLITVFQPQNLDLLSIVLLRRMKSRGLNFCELIYLCFFFGLFESLVLSLFGLGDLFCGLLFGRQKLLNFSRLWSHPFFKTYHLLLMKIQYVLTSSERTNYQVTRSFTSFFAAIADWKHLINIWFRKTCSVLPF